MPPPFPNGWFVLLESRLVATRQDQGSVFHFVFFLFRDLPIGQVRQVDALGLNLAVFRGVLGQGCIHLYIDTFLAQVTQEKCS